MCISPTLDGKADDTLLVDAPVPYAWSFGADMFTVDGGLFT